MTSHTFTSASHPGGAETVPAWFWCNTCRGWSPAADDATDICTWCHDCGEYYQCDECGYEIDHEGTCLRPEGHLPVGEEP
jgi:hypothetical protein